MTRERLAELAACYAAGYSLREVCTRCRASPRTVVAALRAHGIAGRPVPKRLGDGAAARAFYEQHGLSLRATAVALGVSIDTLQRALPYGVVPRNHRLRERAGHWKGGRRLNANGYVCVYAPAHPRAGRNGYVFEHVLVAEHAHGPLNGAEVVHHRNGCRTDNRPENLEVLTRRDHLALHRHEQARRHA